MTILLRTSFFVVVISLILLSTTTCYNVTSMYTLCKSFDTKCVPIINDIITEHTQLLISHSPSSSSSPLSIIETSISSSQKRIFTDALYFKGIYHLYGITSQSPQLEQALCEFIISSYYGNPHSHFKLYLFISTDLISHTITSSTYTSLVSSNPFLSLIAHTPFYNNIRSFPFNSPEYNTYRPSIAFTFLYSAALAKDISALLALAHNYKIGKHVNANCSTSTSYYKEAANVAFEHRLGEPSLIYEFTSLEIFEYVKTSLESKIVKHGSINELIDQYKLETKIEKKKQFIPQIGLMLLFGYSTKQNLNEAIKWFRKGLKNNETQSMYYLGLIYLHGWGVEHNYQKAMDLFYSLTNMNYDNAYVEIGYMYYYGLGVRKNIPKALEYYKKALSNKISTEPFERMLYTHIHYDNNDNDNDYFNLNIAYKYASFLSNALHSFYGDYFFAMMNYYNIDSHLINYCGVNLKLFKRIAEENENGLHLYTYALQLYKNKKYKNAFLILLDLAEQGYESALNSVSILLKKYTLLKDKSFQKYLFVKYASTAQQHCNDNYYIMIILADFFFEENDYEQAVYYYKQIITKATVDTEHNKDNKPLSSGSSSSNNNNNANKKGNSFYLAHSYYKLGYMANYGLGMDKNITKANYYFDMARKEEDVTKYPVFFIKVYNKLNSIIENGEVIVYAMWFIVRFVFSRINICVLVIFVLVYGWFYYDLKMQETI